jgi:hypothetical protein
MMLTAAGPLDRFHGDVNTSAEASAPNKRPATPGVCRIPWPTVANDRHVLHDFDLVRRAFLSDLVEHMANFPLSQDDSITRTQRIDARRIVSKLTRWRFQRRGAAGGRIPTSRFIKFFSSAMTVVTLATCNSRNRFGCVLHLP